jgi:TetR/AcrR family transcriptional regulator
MESMAKMGTAERHKRERQARIELILDAAEKVAAMKGLHNSTMEEIAKKAELGKSTVYLYFRSKDALYLGLDLRGSHIQERMFVEAAASRVEGLARVMAIGRAYFKYAEEYPVYFQAKAHLGPVTLETLLEYKDDPMLAEYQEVTGSCNQVLINAIKAGQADGTIRKDANPMVLAILLWGESNGVIEVILNRKEPLRQFLGLEPESIMENYFDSMERALTPAIK